MTTIENEINQNGYYVFTVSGISMMPIIRPGRDLAIIESHQGRYKVKDAVLFKRDNGVYVLHRVKKVRDNDYIIVGDNSYENEPVRDDQILGILTTIKRNDRTIKSTDFWYRVYVAIWTNPVGGRVIVLSIRRVLSFIKRGIKKIVHRNIQNS